MPTPPRWSVVIPAHNCAPLLDLTLQSVMGQLGLRDDAEIVVVDDGSDDHPERIVRRVGGDRVRLVRNEKALGAVPNFNACLAQAHGELIHLLHGDDLVLPGFYAHLEEAFARDSVAAAFCRTQHVDGHGNPIAVTRSYVPGGGVWPGALEHLAASNRVATPAIVVRRSTYDRVGTFDESLPHAADWDMWTRAATAGDIYFVDRVLAHYRVHGANDTSKRLRTGANMSERFAALDRMIGLLPAEERPAQQRRGAALAAAYSARQAARSARAGDLRTASVQAAWTGRSLVRAVRGR